MLDIPPHHKFPINKMKIWILTLIMLGFLKVVFPGGREGGGQFDAPFIFHEELIQLQ